MEKRQSRERKTDKMRYRKLPHGEENISILGLGMGSIHNSSPEEIEQTVRMAMEYGINFFDMAASNSMPYESYARAFAGRRGDMILQMHFGADYQKGNYGWTRYPAVIRKNFEWELDILGTDYADFGYIHCIDDKEDYEKIMRSGIWDYIKSEKENGRVRHLGFSTHNPDMARRLLDTGVMDLFMFSINPAYDFSKGDYGIGNAEDRARLYRECEKAGVGISVMKPFGGGQLLDAKLSPFGRELTRYQCIQYALDRPAVLTVLPGIRGKQDLKEILGFLEASEQEKDYSVIGEFTPGNENTSEDTAGNCVYCNHCQPCPAQLDIGLINKYYDLAKAGDALAKSHYDKLGITAKDCISCGQCEKQCPFHVRQMSRMQEIREYFKK